MAGISCWAERLTRQYKKNTPEQWRKMVPVVALYLCILMHNEDIHCFLWKTNST